MNDEVNVVFGGMLAELMMEADPTLYRPFMSYATGQTVLYVLLQSSLCYYLKSVLLFYEKLVGDLEAYGFNINLCDPCVANKYHSVLARGQPQNIMHKQK